MKKECWIGLSSNFESHKNICYAHKELYALFDAVFFSSLVLTHPINYPWPYMFSNQVARGLTNLSKKHIILCLKKIERDCGRADSDKMKGIIRLDLDLLIYDTVIIKPNDMKLPHILTGMDQLK